MFRGFYKAFGVMLTACLMAANSYATVVLPKILGNGMVLQRNQTVPVWGTAAKGEKITVRFAGQTKTAIADTGGKWRVFLKSMEASAKGRDLVISGTNKIVLSDILVGEVWLCSGQSNMQYEMRKNSKVARPDTSTANSPIDELERAHNPAIRIFLVDRKRQVKPDSTHSGWSIAQDSALRAFSAAGYFFAKKIHAELKVPVGIISSAVSGSRIEPWINETAFNSEPYFKTIKVDGDPGKFYHPMIETLAPYAIKGFLWYQGESNVGETMSYIYKMQVLINSWRKLWGNDKLPFYYVQLAPYTNSVDKKFTNETLPEFREAQVQVLQIPRTGMIVTTDLNDNVKNIHPPFKWEIGRRLALVALAKTYGLKNEYSGPVYAGMSVDRDQVILKFDHVGKGLISNNGKPLTHFVIAGADKKFVPANVMIKDNVLVVSSPDIKKPVAVRFAWDEAAQPNFYNKDGLPAMPFRTDNPLKYKPAN
ncbi:sialate O-acetylesterase [uncultured Mucilaginibacter sp.]|uniref:sialate O-acetylesterase n=1 Tax=uncultured Mucilaginibacter sp. TaxID=797541 RepID=UPI0025E605EC|nr:sialate O-acetylesterase [uncultured Mucilaginibacter sp.]